MRMGHGRGRSRRRRRQASVWQFASASRFAERDAQYAERRGVCSMVCSVASAVYGNSKKHQYPSMCLWLYQEAQA